MSYAPSSSPRARSYWPIDRYMSVLVDAAAVLLSTNASARQREQARRRFELLHDECCRRWPMLFTRRYV